MSTLLITAERIARIAHRDQTRKDGKPYITHPQAVAESMSSEEGKIVAWLHDVLEDTPITETGLLVQGIPEKLIYDIQTVTRMKDETYFHFIKRVSEGSDNAISVKINDIFHNLSDLEEGSLKDKYRFALNYLETRQFLRKH